MTDKITKTDEEWRSDLTNEEYEVCRMKGTERAFTGMYWDCKEKECIDVEDVMWNFFHLKQNLIQEQVGQVFLNHKKMITQNTLKIEVMEWLELK